MFETFAVLKCKRSRRPTDLRERRVSGYLPPLGVDDCLFDHSHIHSLIAHHSWEGLNHSFVMMKVSLKPVFMSTVIFHELLDATFEDLLISLVGLGNRLTVLVGLESFDGCLSVLELADHQDITNL